jgi:hypothetical protein
MSQSQIAMAAVAKVPVLDAEARGVPPCHTILVEKAGLSQLKERIVDAVDQPHQNLILTYPNTVKLYHIKRM